MGRRTTKRINAVFPARLSGTDANGRPFLEIAYTLDVSPQGARLGGVQCLLNPGNTVEIQFQHRKSRFEVKWVRAVVDGSSKYQVGVQCLQPERDLWNLGKPEKGGWRDEFVGLRCARERADPRYPVDMRAEVKHVGAIQGDWVNVTNLSLGGCYCRTARPLPVLTRVCVTLRTVGRDISLLGVVRTIHSATGMAIEFVDSEPRESERLKELIATLDKGANRDGLSAACECFQHTFVQLRKTEELLQSAHLDASLLREILSALEQMRTTASAVQRSLELAAASQPAAAGKNLQEERASVSCLELPQPALSG